MALFAIVAIFTGPASAAVNTAATVAQATQMGTVTGKVVDANGAAVSGATLLIEGGGTRQTTTTSETGTYSFSVAPGIYTITINKGGYQTGSTGVTVPAGETETVNAQLTAVSLSSVNTIGRTSATVTNNQAIKFNIASSSQGQLTTTVIRDRNTNGINNIITEIPGITINHSSSNPNTYIYIRGTNVEAKTLIDGHPIASGISGTTYSMFTSSAILGGIDVTKGAGIGNPTAGYSGVGTANIRTLDFTAKDSGFLQGGFDNFLGTQYTAIVDLNFFDNKVQFIAGKSYYGYTGPTQGIQANAVGIVQNGNVTSATGQTVGTNATRIPNFGYAANYLTAATIGWQGDFSNTYGIQGYTGKIRFNFSPATSLTGSFLGLYGNYFPQGGAYGQFVGNATVPYCLNGATNAPLYTAAACTAAGKNSVYNAPSAQILAGQTNVPIYTFYPGSNVHFEQPIYDADFKTTLGNDTILLRPYWATIQRLIDGQAEPQTFGYGGGTYIITKSSECQVTYVKPTATTEARGPCLPANAAAGSPAYVGANNTIPVVFATTTVDPGCSPTNPCYTSSTQVTNTGAYGYTSPYTTYETDSLFGYTFSYIHPDKRGDVFNVAFDHYYDQAADLVNDASGLAAGCQFTVGGGTLPTTPITYNGNTYGPQPTCTAFPANVSRSSPISVPPTFSSVSSLSLTAQFAITPKLEFDLGNYFTYYNINAQQEDQGLLAAYAAYGAAHPASGVSTASAPVLLQGIVDGGAHYDPHFGLVFRPTNNISLRGTAGSSIVIPYAAQVSGLGSINLAGTGANQTATISIPNPYLRPENVAAYDIGGDFRFKHGAVISTDIYNNVVYNAWLSPTVPTTAPPGATYGAGGVFQTKYINTSDEIFQGVEFAAGLEPKVGFGGKISASAERAYYLNLPQSIVQSPIAANGQPIIQPITAFNGEQVDQIPYLRGYAEIQYAGRHQELIRFGADYEGNNNAYNAPAIWIFDSTLRVPVYRGFTLQISGSNIFNVTNSSYLSQGVYNQGRVQTGYTYLPTGLAATNVGYNPVTNSASLVGTQGFVNPGFRTFVFSVQKQF